MKLKALNALIMVISMFICVTAIADNVDTIDYFFQKKFQSLKLKNTLRIVRVRHLDGFEQPFSECLPNFYYDTLGVKSYELEDREQINKIGISEYVFKDTVAASNAFRLAYSYAESIRKNRLEDFNKLCFTMPAPQVYFASRDGSHVYIYTTLYNFLYHSKEDSVDGLMQSDKRILLDDLYQEMTENSR